MKTGKWLMILSLCSLLILIASNLVAPNSFLFWLADHSMRFQYVREALAVILFIQLLPLKQAHSLMSRIIEYTEQTARTGRRKDRVGA